MRTRLRTYAPLAAAAMSLLLAAGCATEPAETPTAGMRLLEVQGETPQLPEVVMRDFDVLLRQWQTVRNDNDLAQERALANKLGAKALQHYPALINGLVRGEDFERRIAAAALGFLRPDEDDPKVMDSMKIPQAAEYLSGLTTDEQAEVRAAALWSLGRLAFAETPLAPLVRLANDDLEPPVVRAAGLYALGRLYDAERDTPDRQFYATVLNRLADTHPFVRESAVHALITIDDARCVEHLVAYTLNDTDPNIRFATLMALEGFDDPRVISDLVFLLSDTNDDIVLETMQVLRGHGEDPRVQHAIREKLTDARATVRGAAAETLGFLGPSPATVEALIARARNREEELAVRRAALKSLMLLGDLQLVPRIIPLLDERVPEIVEDAHALLVAVSGKSTIDADPFPWEEWARRKPELEGAFPEDYVWHTNRKKNLRVSSLGSTGSGTTARRPTTTARPTTPSPSRTTQRSSGQNTSRFTGGTRSSGGTRGTTGGRR